MAGVKKVYIKVTRPSIYWREIEQRNRACMNMKFTIAFAIKISS
jgi:hypothetical protein